jgi:hypothetical protein
MLSVSRHPDDAGENASAALRLCFVVWRRYVPGRVHAGSAFWVSRYIASSIFE